MEEDNDFNYAVFHQYLKNPINVPNDFEMLYLGGQILNGDLYDNNLIKVKSIIFNHAIILNYKVFDYIIENIEKEWNQVDNWDKKEGLEKQVNWDDGKIDKFYSKHICEKRKNSYLVYPLLCYKEPRQIEEHKISQQNLSLDEQISGDNPGSSKTEASVNKELKTNSENSKNEETWRNYF